MQFLRKLSGLGVLALAFALPGLASGAEPSPWRLGLALGLGERSNPLVQSDPVPIAVDIDIAYFGRRFFFDNGDLGVTAVNSDRGTLNLIARVNSDRVFFGKTDARFVQFSAAGAPLATPVQLRVPDRSYAVEAGAEWLADGRWGRLALAAFGDVSGAHRGFGADAEYSHAWQGARWTLEPSIVLRYKSAALNNYYWGVRPGEASAALPAYEAGDGFNWQAGLRASYYLSRHWRVAASLQYEALNRSAADSPLTRDDSVLGYFAGLAWRF